ncbi:MAG: hypothetical protein EOP37_08985 [Rubrivivax sp.]|nr:MAG: hypothetical protein EOP37_08985 [Rubrivivax sp.]
MLSYPSSSSMQTQGSNDLTQGAAMWAQGQNSQTTIEQLVNQVGVNRSKATISLANAFGEMSGSVRMS